jgi:Tfp pilus assembly protein PilX
MDWNTYHNSIVVAVVVVVAAVVVVVHNPRTEIQPCKVHNTDMAYIAAESAVKAAEVVLVEEDLPGCCSATLSFGVAAVPSNRNTTHMDSLVALLLAFPPYRSQRTKFVGLRECWLVARRDRKAFD